jgi:ribose 5-phosphate isomerase B
MLYLGADHAGFALKEQLKKFLTKEKIAFVDLGSSVRQANDDYPLIAQAVARAVVKNKANRGLLICGSGLGMAIAANKVKGARAVPIYDRYTAVVSRQHNNANIATLRARAFPVEATKRLVKIWLSAKFSAAARHQRRLKQLEQK